MKLYKDFLAERAFSPAGQAARVKMKSQAGLNVARKAAQDATPKALPAARKQLALPPGKTGGAMISSPKGAMTPSPRKAAQGAADKGAAIVRTKRGGTGKEAIGGNKMKSGPGVRQPDKGPGSKTYDRTTKDGSALAKYNPDNNAMKKKGYLGKVKDSAGKQFKKNTVDNFSADKVGRGIANAPGNAARNVLKSIGRSSKRSLRNNPTQDSPKGNIEKVQNNNAIG